MVALLSPLAWYCTARSVHTLSESGSPRDAFFKWAMIVSTGAFFALAICARHHSARPSLGWLRSALTALSVALAGLVRRRLSQRRASASALNAALRESAARAPKSSNDWLGAWETRTT